MRLSDAEWTIMGALWDGASATGREVLERIPATVEWSYSTVKTLLARLVAKGAVEEAKRGKVSVFSPLLSQDRARRSAVKSLLDRAFDGAFGSLVHHLVAEERLSAKDRERLRELLDAEEQP